MIPPVLAHYRLLRPIGAGGMGEVHEAEDTKLGRRVALKVLAPEFATDPERRERFEREARAVAALNHPNIVTIHSVEQQDGLLFLTMELVEGETLGELIPAGGMSLQQWLKTAIPLAEAVAAAHQRGITHRDLKPANVMITRDGRLKVLDFGLAKLHESSTLGEATATATGAQVTGEGRILGTFAYMSPEQALGKIVDARSDIFSLGVLLYEAATGDRPFKGENNLSLLSAILKDTPASVVDVRPALPRDVGRIIRRCLAKDPDARYQTAKDLRNDLRLFEEELASGVLSREATRLPSGTNIAGPPAQARRARPRIVGVATVVLLAAGLVGTLWYLRERAAGGPSPFTSIGLRRLTTTGNADLAAISPDGRYVVHVVGSIGKPSLWIRQVSTASNVQIVPPTEGRYAGLGFSPDGEGVLYVFGTPQSLASSLYQVPLLGGTPRKLIDDVDVQPTFSPDGRRMAFIRGLSDGRQAIVLVNPDGTDERTLASRPPLDGYAQTGLAWSPDGKAIAGFAGTMPWRRGRIVIVDTTTGKDTILGEAEFDVPGQLAWLPDGSALVFDALGRNAGFGASGQIWWVSYPGGVVRRITNDLANYSSLSMARNGRTLAAVQHQLRASLWVAAGGDSARARPITNSSHGREGAVGLGWTPDGRIVYGAMTQDSWDVWIVNADGTAPRQLTNDPGVEALMQATSDGGKVAFIFRPAETAVFHVASVDIEGGRPRQLTDVPGTLPWTLDVARESIVFTRTTERGPVAFRTTLDGRPPQPLFNERAALPPFFRFARVSRDGGRAFGTTRELKGVLVPLEPPGPAQILPVTLPAGSGPWVWAPDSDAMDVVVRGETASNIWRYPFDGSAPTQLTTFSSEQIIRFAWAPDGKTLAMSRGSDTADVVLITSDDAADGRGPR